MGFALLAVSCSSGHDPAEREYILAVRGEDEGMTRAVRLGHLDRAIALSPNRSYYWEARALHRIAERNFDRARSDLDRAIQLQDRPYLRFLRGLALCQGGKPAESLADFDAAIAGHPDNAQFYRGRALARAALGKNDDALQDAERLISLAPEMAEAYYARGIALSHLGRDEEAVLNFGQALQRRPELVYPLHARAASYERTGDAERAAADRAEAARKERDRGSCAPCLDPFRY